MANVVTLVTHRFRYNQFQKRTELVITPKWFIVPEKVINLSARECDAVMAWKEKKGNLKDYWPKIPKEKQLIIETGLNSAEFSVFWKNTPEMERIVADNKGKAVPADKRRKDSSVVPGDRR